MEAIMTADMARPTQEALLRYEEKGLKFLRAMAQGDTAAGRQAKEKVLLIEQFKQNHPDQYQALLIKNYLNDHPVSETSDDDESKFKKEMSTSKGVGH